MASSTSSSRRHSRRHSPPPLPAQGRDATERDIDPEARFIERQPTMARLPRAVTPAEPLPDLPEISGRHVVRLPTRPSQRLPSVGRRRRTTLSLSRQAAKALLSGLLAAGITLAILSIGAPWLISHGWLAATATKTAVVAPPPRIYVVQPGDNLGDIAARELGNHDLWPQIFAKNRALLHDPSELEVGQHLVLPPAPTGGGQ